MLAMAWTRGGNDFEFADYVSVADRRARAKKAADMKDQWDIYDPLGTVPGPGEDLETIAPPKDGVCKIG